MSFFSTGLDTRDLDAEKIYFTDMSEEAQKKALAFKGVSDHRDMNWDIFPVYRHYESKSNLSQEEIDTEALSSLGFYRL